MHYSPCYAEHSTAGEQQAAPVVDRGPNRLLLPADAVIIRPYAPVKKGDPAVQPGNANDSSQFQHEVRPADGRVSALGLCGGEGRGAVESAPCGRPVRIVSVAVYGRSVAETSQIVAPRRPPGPI